jgi:hypothetical protein
MLKQRQRTMVAQQRFVALFLLFLAWHSTDGRNPNITDLRSAPSACVALHVPRSDPGHTDTG